MGETIHFYYINDLHSHFEHWPRIQQFIRKRKEQHNNTEEETIVLDIGDNTDRFHPFTEAFLGKGNVKLLNELGCDYATIGNNEGITFPFAALDRLYDEAQFKVLVANLFYPNGQRPSWAQPYSIHVTKLGARIAFIGATAYFRVFYEKLGWRVTEPYEEISRVVNELEGKCDCIVLLSHLGLEFDEQVAATIPEISVILGAHTHHILHQGKMIEQTLLCGAGKGGTYVGHAELSMDDLHQLTDVSTRLFDMNKQPAAMHEKEYVHSLHEIGKEKMMTEICSLQKPLGVEWFNESPLVRLLCDSLRAWCDADCAFINAGLLLDGLDEGIVTAYDIHKICPHPINPCLIEVSGSELKEILVQSMDEKWPHMQIKGFGFRGNIFGMMIYSNIHILSKHEIYIGGELLQPAKQYKLALPDMFTFGYFFPSITRTDKKQYFLPEFLRDILAESLRTH
ncbi:bifunctional metallophosphatase/5'-nucleotidase [Bacillus sp. AGMB 02131]|uniref:Bifunctional metallophosphatase/5'-nucleotidase n=1 Tax=Peribacillus faecalis TaxID=2772559 RepID=A0A927HB78_9BACI|nr:bifunctional UDP-sugar hydrolase/5'-nucleotidase [Peribacillus faecalis]MBD3108216.1 bifunctional metallophosphatase/5'-nucleotidase [Peribacillus faecalis]